MGVKFVTLEESQEAILGFNGGEVECVFHLFLMECMESETLENGTMLYVSQTKYQFLSALTVHDVAT